jgi:predicted esterase
MSVPLFHPRAAGALALALTLPALAARGEVIIMKDGYTLHGVKIIKEKEEIIDKDTGMSFVGNKINGVTAIDDYVRWVIFPTSLKQVADVAESNKFKDLIGYSPKHSLYVGEKPLPSTLAGEGTVHKPWDYKLWERELRFLDSVNKSSYHTVKQHISVINPHYIRIGSSSYRINRYFLTKEFPAEVLRKFLENHPDLAEPDGKADPEKREKWIRFWIQADWLEEAEKDLVKLQADLPMEKKRYDSLRSEVNALRAERLMVEVERAKDSGRHQWARQTLSTFAAKEDVPKSVAVKATALKAEYETLFAQFSKTKGYLAALPQGVPAGNQFLLAAAAAVNAELHPDTLARLEMFSTLAERAEKDAKAGRKPAHTAAELLAAAVTGWHLGKVSAEAKVDLAYRCWTARQMALEYLRTPRALDREKILTAYLGNPQAFKYDELEKLISFLPPPDAPATLPVGTVQTSVPPIPELPQGMNYVLRLPDEYQPGRSYPLLILLPDGSTSNGANETPADLVARFGDLPSRLGYIVAAPQWLDANTHAYTYLPAEREQILVFLRHLKRTYQVDSDRVSLWGNGQGGALALDLGMTNPDLWAGISPVNPPIYTRPYISCEGWVNFHQLPVYLIMGDRATPAVPGVRALNERWMPKGFPTLVVSYKGRGVEWFAEELPYAFDWLGRKRRAETGKTLGPLRQGHVTGDGYTSVRAGPNRFHWLSTGAINPAYVLQPILTGQAPNAPARFYAKLSEGNLVDVKVAGMSTVTVWFGKGMLDYTKPVSFRVNNGRMTKQTVTPSPAVLMEDLFSRGDRQRPFFEKVELKAAN